MVPRRAAQRGREEAERRERRGRERRRAVAEQREREVVVRVRRARHLSRVPGVQGNGSHADCASVGEERGGEGGVGATAQTSLGARAHRGREERARTRDEGLALDLEVEAEVDFGGPEHQPDGLRERGGVSAEDGTSRGTRARAYREIGARVGLRAGLSLAEE